MRRREAARPEVAQQRGTHRRVLRRGLHEAQHTLFARGGDAERDHQLVGGGGRAIQQQHQPLAAIQAPLLPLRQGAPLHEAP